MTDEQAEELALLSTTLRVLAQKIESVAKALPIDESEIGTLSSCMKWATDMYFYKYGSPLK